MKQWARWRKLRNTKKFKLLYCEKSENKIKAEHPKKFKLLCLRTCTHGVFEIKIVTLICSSTFYACNMPKNILNHYTTKKGRKTQKVGHRKQWARWRRLRNTKKYKLLYCKKPENKTKAEHPKKINLLCLRTCTLGFF